MGVVFRLLKGDFRSRIGFMWAGFRWGRCHLRVMGSVFAVQNGVGRSPKGLKGLINIQFRSSFGCGGLR